MAFFSGSCAALVTPFKNNKVDFLALEKLIDFQILSGTDAILVLGTTGEASCLTDEERKKIICFAKEKINNKAQLFVGTGANSTKKTIKNTRIAKECGANAVLVVTPYYNKCTQEGAVLHYSTIANAVDIPIIVYNVPSRTGFNLLPQTTLKLSEIKNIVGIKEANGNIDHILELFYLCKDKLAIYSGNDSLNKIFLSFGGDGVISVVANVLPKQIKTQCIEKNLESQSYLHNLLYNISKLCFVETNPIPVKYFLSKMKLIQNQLRLPLTPLSQKYQKQLDEELEKHYRGVT